MCVLRGNQKNGTQQPVEREGAGGRATHVYSSTYHWYHGTMGTSTWTLARAVSHSAPSTRNSSRSKPSPRQRSWEASSSALSAPQQAGGLREQQNCQSGGVRQRTASSVLSIEADRCGRPTQQLSIHTSKPAHAPVICRMRTLLSRLRRSSSRI
jgi:hypothetical protein